MKLDYKKTIFVGFAFFLICAFWSAYDTIIPLILVNKFNLSQASSGVIMALDNALAVFLLPIFGSLSDKTNSKFGKRTPYIILGTIVSVITFTAMSTADSLIVFMLLLLLTLLAMSTFRSPAVALMPDVTVKPLRSQGNAVINLLGAVGGIIVLILGVLFKTSEKGKTDFTFYIIAVCGIMIIGLVLFVALVKEKQWAKEMEDQSKTLDNDETEENQNNLQVKLSKPQLKSLLFILLSVAFWYMGYNAITSKYSLYASQVLHKDYALTLMIAQAAAIVSYIPIGYLSSYLGRKKSIIIGVILLAVAFASAIFITADSPTLIINISFALAGFAWATINVNSFPMVVELAKGGSVGKFTGYYYTASMLAQILTPILSGAIMTYFFNDAMTPLFPYATIFVVFSLITMLFVKHGDCKPAKKENILEHLDIGD